MFRITRYLVTSIGLLLLIGSSFALADTKLDPNDVVVPKGYKVEPFVSNLSVPTTAIFDESDLLVAESGFLNIGQPRVLRIKPDGAVSVEVSEGLQAPVTGLLMVNGKLYISHRTKVSVLENGKLEDIVTELPSLGDHQNDQIVLGPDGKIYMGQGTVTNTGVVGVDNYIFGWLDKNPQLHETPCKDITLTGQNFESDNPLTDADDTVTTGAYKPFGTPSTAGEVIPGNVKCGGSIVRFNPDGSGFELVAWGLRNPFGLSFDSAGQLWATYHGADVRGSRTVYNDPDYLVKVEQGAWYGWPEYFDGQPVTAARFRATGHAQPTFLWKEHPTLAKAYMTFPSHSATNGFAVAPKAFGYEGDMFVAMFGSFAPLTSGLNVRPAGFRVVRVHLADKSVTDFLTNKLPGPAYLNGSKGLNRPSDVVFGPDGSMYVLDWGGAKLSEKGLEITPGSGAIWRVYPESGQALRPQGPIEVTAASSSEPIQPIVPNISETYKEILPQWAWPLLLLVLVIGAIVYLVRRSRSRR